ncbi:MAG: ABC transporter substrate-binding protein [Rhodospirillales bacterium]|nr:ABC transporter substrate-binding protein [Rhodospirillales bacterium]
MGPTVLGHNEAKAAEPQRGGTLRMGIGHGSTTDSLDPATYENGFTSGMGMGGLFNYLTAVDEQNQLEPELAEEWEASPDAKVWTFRIRKGPTFHNGKDVTPEDIVGSLNYHRGEDSVSAISSLLEQVEDIRARDNTVVITLNASNADFPYIMSDYHLGIQPTAEGRIVDPLSGVGAGSYMLVEYEPGVRAILKRHPNYWKDGYAWFDDVEMTTIADPAARQNALMSGQVDAIDRVDTKTAHMLAQHPSVNLVEATGTLHYTAPMRTDTAPFDDNNVRQALKYAIDRDDIVDKILRGHGITGQDSPITPANRFFADDIDAASYDPDKARWYLQQSGLDSLSVDLSTSEAAFVGAVDMAVLYKEHAAPAGIDINVVRETPDGYWSDVWNKKPWCTCYWGGRPTEDWMFSTAYSADAPWNDTVWSHDRFNELLVQARAELDEGLRREMYREMQEIVSTEGGVVVFAYANNVDAASTNLAHGPHVAGNWNMDGSRLMERWWFQDPTA